MTTTPALTRAVIYVRESMDKYGDARAVERFQEQCEQLCARRGLTVTAVLRDNDVSATHGNKGEGFKAALAMMRDRQMDYLVVPVVDRFLRNPRQLEDLIDLSEGTGIVVLATSGDIDLSHDQGRLVARILVAVAKAEMERKAARQRDANEQAAKKGKRNTSAPRPFGYQPDLVTPEPAEADAIRWAAACLLGGGTVSSVMREWNSRGLVGAQGGKAFTRGSVQTILRNPALAALRAYRGEIVADGTWEPVLPAETWEAVRSLLDASDRTVTYTRKGKAVTRKVKTDTPRGVRTLLGGLALCRCGNAVIGAQASRGYSIYRCDTKTKGDRQGPHLGGVRAEPVDSFVEAVIVGRLARPDLVDLITPPPSVDASALRTEAASIRRNLEQMAADAVLAGYSRAMLTAATERANIRLREITAALASSAQTSALAPFLAGERAQAVWDGLDLARQRAVLRFLASVTVHPAGRGTRSFDPETVAIDWHS